MLKGVIENWRKVLDSRLFAGVVPMDLSNMFDCIPHDILIPKLDAYDLTFDTVTLLYSFLKEKKHNMKINSSNLIIISNLQQFTNNTFRCTTKINFGSNPV